MAYWLLKTEPGEYSWADLARDERVTWDGITNALALKNLRAAAAGDEALVYHTGGERRAVGIARITKAAYPDPKREDPRLVVLDLVPLEPLEVPVTLERIKADPAFAGWDLLRLGRLSFVPVPPAMWKRILELSRGK